MDSFRTKAPLQGACARLDIKYAKKDALQNLQYMLLKHWHPIIPPDLSDIPIDPALFAIGPVFPVINPTSASPGPPPTRLLEKSTTVPVGCWGTRVMVARKTKSRTRMKMSEMHLAVLKRERKRSSFAFTKVRVDAAQRAEGYRHAGRVKTQRSCVKALEHFMDVALAEGKMKDRITDVHRLLLSIDHSAARSRLDKRERGSRAVQSQIVDVLQLVEHRASPLSPAEMCWAESYWKSLNQGTTRGGYVCPPQTPLASSTRTPDCLPSTTVDEYMGVYTCGQNVLRAYVSASPANPTVSRQCTEVYLGFSDAEAFCIPASNAEVLVDVLKPIFPPVLGQRGVWKPSADTVETWKEVDKVWSAWDAVEQVIDKDGRPTGIKLPLRMLEHSSLRHFHHFEAHPSPPQPLCKDALHVCPATLPVKWFSEAAVHAEGFLQ
ncbi:hypothetical protein K523DRAFT_334544 [Schizophyllum commune Tattone D]|nr:hypothetical protein K523DRAFT_334544 [Schizophyllum commune Tattone D]